MTGNHANLAMTHMAYIIRHGTCPVLSFTKRRSHAVVGRVWCLVFWWMQNASQRQDRPGPTLAPTGALSLANDVSSRPDLSRFFSLLSSRLFACSCTPTPKSCAPPSLPSTTDPSATTRGPPPERLHLHSHRPTCIFWFVVAIPFHAGPALDLDPRSIAKRD